MDNIDLYIMLIFGGVIFPTSCLYLVYRLRKKIGYDNIPEDNFPEAVPLNF